MFNDYNYVAAMLYFIVVSCKLYKPVSDWLEMLPLDSTALALNM